MAAAGFPRSGPLPRGKDSALAPLRASFAAAPRRPRLRSPPDVCALVPGNFSSTGGLTVFSTHPPSARLVLARRRGRATPRSAIKAARLSRESPAIWKPEFCSHSVSSPRLGHQSREALGAARRTAAASESQNHCCSGGSESRLQPARGATRLAASASFRQRGIGYRPASLLFQIHCSRPSRLNQTLPSRNSCGTRQRHSPTMTPRS